MTLSPLSFTCRTLSRPLISSRAIHTSIDIHPTQSLGRSYLYVPSSNPKMLAKSLVSSSDTIIYDLEDSVGPAQKPAARQGLMEFIKNSRKSLLFPRVAVRVNALNTPFFADDMLSILSEPSIETLVIPKVNSAEDLTAIANHIPAGRTSALNLVASIESAKALWSIGDIASWNHGVAKVSALLFAAEDYCADTGIIRTESRQELLYTRSKVVVAAKAFGLSAIDMVCVDYKNPEYLREECEDGRRLGFDGKQAIHPNQVDVIQSTFVPSTSEIKRAQTIIRTMEISRSSEGRGAFGLETSSGGKEMIDEPMLKQALSTLAKARAAGLITE